MSKTKKKASKERVVGEKEVLTFEDPEWVAANREKMIAALSTEGVEFLSEEDVKKRYDDDAAIDSELESAAKQLGIDLVPSVDSQSRERLDVTDLVIKIDKQIALVMQSGEWKSVLSQKEKLMLYAVGIFCRQILSLPPRNRDWPQTIAELLVTTRRIDMGVFNMMGVARKPIRCTREIYERARILTESESVND